MSIPTPPEPQLPGQDPPFGVPQPPGEPTAPPGAPAPVEEPPD
jgi:hypothetical protein